MLRIWSVIVLERDPPEHAAAGGEDDGEREEEAQGEEEHVVGDIRGLQHNTNNRGRLMNFSHVDTSCTQTICVHFLSPTFAHFDNL